MELAALGLAANILQLVDASAKVISILRNGSTASHADLTSDTNNLKVLLTRVQDPGLQSFASENQQLKAISEEAVSVADELLGHLSRASADGNGTFWDKMSASFNAFWNSGTIKAKEERLKEMRANLQFGVILELEKKAERDGTISDTTLRSIGEHTRAAIEGALQRFQGPIEDINLSAGRILDRITARLDFHGREQRGDSIDPKHAKTFEWIYDNPKNHAVPWVSFVDWLKTPGGVYWISGRAGSGKSTLMKFLDEFERTRLGNVTNGYSFVSASDEQRPLVLSFYFWSAGNQLAKSQEGLFRSLLLQALLLDPSLGPILFPAQYEPEATWLSFPTFGQLTRAFDNLTKQTSRRVLFIIDGLDEFEVTRISVGELSERFANAAKSLNVKALLSSRPLSDIEALLGTAQLHLHDLTRTDIVDYVNSKLREKPGMAELLQESPNDAASLVENVVDLAKGVFLWVRLIVRSLVEGLNYGDSMEHLKGRLAELPPDLETLFERMLSKIDPRYQLPSSRIFQLVQAGKDVDSLFPTTSTLYYADLSHHDILAAGVQPITLEEQEARARKMEARLKAYTAGLIEVQPSRRPSPLGLEVDYIHRTAADFVRKNWAKCVRNTLQTIGPGTSAHESLLDCILMQVKTHPLETADSDELRKSKFGSLWELVLGAMDIAKHFHCAAEDTFDELERVMDHHFNHSPENIQGEVNWTSQLCMPTSDRELEPPWKECHDNFFCFAVRYNLVDYVLAKTKRHGKRAVQKKGRPALHCLSLLYDLGPPGEYQPAIVEALLRNGADPNEKFQARSPWEHMLNVQDSTDFVPPDDFKDRLLVYKLFLEYGANPKATMERCGLYWTLRFSALYLFLDMFYKRNDPRYKPLETEIIKLLRRKGAKAKQWKLVVIHGSEDTIDRPHSVWQRRYPVREGGCLSYLDEADFVPSWKKRLTRKIRPREENGWVMGSKGSIGPSSSALPPLPFSRHQG